MAEAYSKDLRRRAVAFVERGNSQQPVAPPGVSGTNASRPDLNAANPGHGRRWMPAKHQNLRIGSCSVGPPALTASLWKPQSGREDHRSGILCPPGFPRRSKAPLWQLRE